MRRVFVMAAMVVVSIVVAPTAGMAQTTTTAPYPIATPAEVQSFGAQRVGETFNKHDCGFQPGATADIRLNNTAAGTKTVGSDGCVDLQVTVTAEDRVTIDGREFAANRCRANTIFVTAPAAGGAARQHQAENRFTIVCAAAARGGVLPRTGQEFAGISVAGAALTVVGALLVVAVRRRRAATDEATA